MLENQRLIQQQLHCKKDTACKNQYFSKLTSQNSKARLFKC